MVRTVGEYEIGRKLGEGTFGKVKLATNTITGEKVAIKILDKAKIVAARMTEQIKRELVDHANVVRLIDAIATRTKVFDEATARKYFQQLVAGVEYCHLNGIAHRDLKPENLLVSADGVLKISDFGLSGLFRAPENESNDVLLHTTCGTPNYVAPEVLSEAGYDGRAVDIWSLGVILYVFLAGFLPFEEANQEYLFWKIRRAEYAMPPWFSEESRSEPTKRLTMEEIKAHSWFQRPNWVPPPLISSPSREQLASTTVFASEEEKESSDTDFDTPAELPVVNGIQITNAFDLISQSGVFAFKRILTRTPKEEIRRYSRFCTEAEPDEMLTRLQTILKNQPCKVKAAPKLYKLKIVFSTTSGIVKMNIEVFSLAPSLLLVDFKRQKWLPSSSSGPTFPPRVRILSRLLHSATYIPPVHLFTLTKGDLLMFQKLYREISDRCRDMKTTSAEATRAMDASWISGVEKRPTPPEPELLSARHLEVRYAESGAESSDPGNSGPGELRRSDPDVGNTSSYSLGGNESAPGENPNFAGFETETSVETTDLDDSEIDIGADEGERKEVSSRGGSRRGRGGSRRGEEEEEEESNEDRGRGRQRSARSRAVFSDSDTGNDTAGTAADSDWDAEGAESAVSSNLE